MATLLLATATLAAAQSDDKSTTLSVSSKQKNPPDYSRKSLLEIFLNTDADQKAPPSAFDGGLTLVDHPNFRLRWVPFLAPLVTSNNPATRFSPLGSLSVDPFALTHSSFAYTAKSARDPFKEWKFRRMLRKNEEAAKKARGED
jgi:hypothetical protein